jgi:hypothetical protein
MAIINIYDFAFHLRGLTNCYTGLMTLTNEGLTAQPRREIYNHLKFPP